jgi:hypothetical protein
MGSMIRIAMMIKRTTRDTFAAVKDWRILTSQRTKTPWMTLFDAMSSNHVSMVAFLAKELLNDNPTVKEALRSDMRDDWIEAIKAEVLNLLATGAIVPCKFSDKNPEDKVIYFTWILKIKRFADSDIDKLKARGCAMGNMLSKMPKFEKYSPTVSPIVTAAVLAIATFLKIKTCTVDTVSAYLTQEYKDDLSISSSLRTFRTLPD